MHKFVVVFGPKQGFDKCHSYNSGGNNLSISQFAHSVSEVKDIEWRVLRPLKPLNKSQTPNFEALCIGFQIFIKEFLKKKRQNKTNEFNERESDEDQNEKERKFSSCF